MPAVQPTIIQGDLQVNGKVSMQGLNIPANAVSNASIQAGATGNFVAASKIQQQYRPHYSQPNAAAITETKAIWTARSAGVIADIFAGSIAVAAGAATVTIDLKKNGTSILNTVITLNNANTARVAVAGSLMALPNSAFVAGDFLELVVVATAGGGTLPTGVLVQLTIQEDPF